MTPQERAEQTIRAYRLLFDQAKPEARLVIEDLAVQCRMLSTSHVPGDPCSTAHNEGLRAVFLHIARNAGLVLLNAEP
jgi:hypothetical protein